MTEKNNYEKFKTSLSGSVRALKSVLKENRNSYLRMIDGIVYGEDPRQGFIENNVFYHPELKFKFPIPQGWRVNNLPVQVQMTPEDGKAMMTMDLAAGTDLNAAANEVIQKNQLTVI